MANTDVKIWIWITGGRLFKAISNPATKTIVVYDEKDNVLLKRSGLSIPQMKKIEIIFSLYGARRMDSNKQPFTYL